MAGYEPRDAVDQSTANQYTMRDDAFEWDDRKAAANVRKHGVTFELARLAFDDRKSVEQLDSDETDEERWLWTGRAGRQLIVVCFAHRGPRKRIISARRANKNESEDYFSQNR